MTPPPPEPLLPDADPSGTARAALKALFEKVRRDELSLVERADSLCGCKALWEGLYGAPPGAAAGGSGKGRVSKERRPSRTHGSDTRACGFIIC